jgi:hypothetical protein
MKTSNSRSVRRLVLGTIIMLFAVAAAAADVDDTPDTRMAAAEKYLLANDFTKLMDGALRAGLQGAPEDQKEDLFALAKRHLDYERLSKLMLAAMVKNFTTKELNAMAVFYGSPEGQSALAKLPAYLGDVMPVLQSEIQRTIADIRAELEAKHRSPTGT